MTSPNPDLSIPTCRVCLQNISQEMSSIFDLDEADLDDIFIYEKIEQCAGIEVLRDENFPTFICDNCYGLLKVAYQFRISCRDAEEFLRKALATKNITTQTKHSLEENLLSINKNTNTKREREVRSKTKKCCSKIDSSPKPDLINNEIISANSPTNFEEPIADNFDANDGDILCFDINYYNYDEHNMASDEDKVSIEKINLDLDIEQIPRTKIKNKKNKANDNKSKKSTKTRSKNLMVCKSEKGEKISKKLPRLKKQKKEKHPHICEICGNKFPHNYTLKNHIKRHLNEKSFNCELCGYSSHSNMELVRHLRTHTGAKPYKCQYCTRAFGDHSTLIKHERVHRNERPFECNICGSSFSYPAVLKRHKLIHTGEKPYKCEICGKCFNDRYHLQSHLKTIQHKNDPRVETLLQNIRENNAGLPFDNF